MTEPTRWRDNPEQAPEARGRLARRRRSGAVDARRRSAPFAGASDAPGRPASSGRRLVARTQDRRGRDRGWSRGGHGGSSRVARAHAQLSSSARIGERETAQAGRASAQLTATLGPRSAARATQRRAGARSQPVAGSARRRCAAGALRGGRDATVGVGCGFRRPGHRRSSGRDAFARVCPVGARRRAGSSAADHSRARGPLSSRAAVGRKKHHRNRRVASARTSR